MTRDWSIEAPYGSWRAESTNIQVVSCPGYVRSWIVAERDER
jgi:hypothetical protein